MLKKNMENEEKKKINSNKENIKRKKLANSIGYIFVIVIVLFNILIGVNIKKNPDNIPSVFGKKAFIIISGSMIPSIQIGDIVIVDKIDNSSNIMEGDILAFRSKATIIVHRVMKSIVVGDDVVYKTKGDNNEFADMELVDFKNVEGKCITKIPYMGNILLWINNNISIIVVIAIILYITKFYYNEKMVS